MEVLIRCACYSEGSNPCCHFCRGHKILLSPIFAAVGPRCVTPADGQRVNAMVQDLLNQGYAVKLDFRGVGIVTADFYRAAIGDLQHTFTEDRLSAVDLAAVNLPE